MRKVKQKAELELSEKCQDAPEFLRRHHNLIGNLLEQVRRNPTHSGRLQDLFRELRIHSILEQQIFYPALVETLDGETKSHSRQITRSGVDFYLMLALMLELERTSVADEQFRQSLKTIAERFDQHVQDQELNLFPEISQDCAPWHDQEELLVSRMAARQKELHDKLRSNKIDRSNSKAPASVKHIRCA